MVGTFTPNLPSSVNVTGTGITTATWTSTYVYTPPTEDDDTVDRDFTLQASIDDATNDQVMTVANSGGTTVSSVVLTLNGGNLAVTEGGSAVAVTVSVDATLQTDADAGYSRSVIVDLEDADDNPTTNPLLGTLTLPITVTATVAAGDLTSALGSVTVTYTPPPRDINTTDETVTLRASTGGQTNDATVTINDVNIIASLVVTLDAAANINVSEDSDARGVILGVNIGFDTGNDELTDGQTRKVVVDLASDSGMQGTFSPTFPVTVTATVAGTAATGTQVLTYTPVADSDVTNTTVTLVPSTDGQDGTGDGANNTTSVTNATLTVTDNDRVSSVTLTLSPNQVKDSAGSTDIAVTATVAFGSDQNANDAHDVVVKLAPGSDLAGTLALPITVTVTVPSGDLDAATGSATVAYTPPGDLDSDDSSFNLVASLENQTSPAVTFTVDDDDVPVGTITISVSPEEIREDIGARDVTVTATLDKNPNGVTVAINATLIGDSPIPTSPVATSITFAANTLTGSVTVSLNPSDDDIPYEWKIRVTGSATAAGYVSGHKDIPVIDDDISIGTLTITAASPPSINAGSGATTVTLTVKGALKDKLEDEGTVIATLTTTAGTFPDGTS